MCHPDAIELSLSYLPEGRQAELVVPRSLTLDLTSLLTSLLGPKGLHAE